MDSESYHVDTGASIIIYLFYTKLREKYKTNSFNKATEYFSLKDLRKSTLIPGKVPSDVYSTLSKSITPSQRPLSGRKAKLCFL